FIASLLDSIQELESKLDFSLLLQSEVPAQSLQESSSSLRESEATKAFHNQQTDSSMDCHDFATQNLAMTGLDLKALLDSLPTPPPQGWERVRLGQVSQVIAGQSPQSQFYNDRQEGLLFFQGKKDFGEKYLQNSNVWTSQITKESVKNDILMSVRAPVGDVNLNPYEKICIGRGLATIRAENYAFLFYCILHNKNLFVGKQGMAFESINVDEIKNTKIPLPPLEAQEKIISAIERIESKMHLLDSSLPSLDSKKGEILQHFLQA
uniref:restriction endonuclease subunit S n=1 Tax=uncultured Helicobacter sp. TaxID=175537 RepID=UPI002614F1D2